MRASDSGHDKVVELLLTVGAKVDLQDRVIYSEEFKALIELCHYYERGLMKLFINLSNTVLTPSESLLL